MLNTVSQFTERYLANTEAKHRDFYRLTNRMRGRGDQNHIAQYRRLNCDTQELQFDMADYKSMPKLETKTTEYLATPEAAAAVKEIAEWLAARE
ncbi:hypothetical protein LTR53_018821 [Teratosphaeriaceae sp. CCFEE 6253]|nr:hypothetical protein LTR53_018821 [Teratosphaeriaceae sp. CCFEE 6253]